MHDAVRSGDGLVLITILLVLRAAPETFSAFGSNRNDGDVKRIDQIGREERSDRSDTSPNANVLTICGRLRRLQCAFRVSLMK